MTVLNKGEMMKEKISNETFQNFSQLSEKSLSRQEFTELMASFYADRNWDIQTARPSDESLESLGVGFTI